MAVDLDATQLKLDAIRKLYEEAKSLKAKLTSITPEPGSVSASDFEDDVKALDEKFKAAFAMPITKPNPVVKVVKPVVPEVAPLPKGEIPRWYQWLGLAAAPQPKTPEPTSEQTGWGTWIEEPPWTGEPAQQQQADSVVKEAPAPTPPPAPAKKDLGWSTWLNHKAAEHSSQAEKDDSDAKKGRETRKDDDWEKFI